MSNVIRFPAGQGQRSFSLAEDLAGMDPQFSRGRRDPALIAIERCQELEAEHTRLHQVACHKSDNDPIWEAERPAHEALWAHWRGAVLTTVPTTRKGAKELARYALGFVRRQGTGLDDDGEAVLELIARSPAL